MQIYKNGHNFPLLIRKNFSQKERKKKRTSEIERELRVKAAKLCGVFLTPNKLISLLGQSFCFATFCFFSVLSTFISDILFIYYYYSHFLDFVHHFLTKKCIKKKFFFSLIHLSIQLIIVTAYFLIYIKEKINRKKLGLYVLKFPSGQRNRLNIFLQN